MSVLRRVSPLVASLAAHGAVAAFLAAQAVLPAFGSAGGVEVAAVEDADALDSDSLDSESLDAYLARAADDVDFGEPTAALVAIGIITDEVAVVAHAAPVVAVARVVNVAPVVEAAPVLVEEVPAVVEEAPAVVEEAPVEEAPVQDAPAVAEAEPAVTEEGTPAPDEAVPADSAEAVAAVQPPRRHKQGRSPLRAGRGAFELRDLDPDDGVLRTSRSSWAVERKVVDFYAKNLGELMKLGSVRAHRDTDGKLRGFRVGVKKDSILREAGFRSGDVVKSVNGIEVHDLFGALAAYFKLRKQTHIEVVLTRKGRQMTLSYDLVS